MAKFGMSPKQAQKLRAAKGIEDTKLQRIRTDKGLSQNQLAVASGVALRGIQSYEQRTRQIDGARLDILCSLCLALDCKIEDILENKELIEKFRMTK